MLRNEEFDKFANLLGVWFGTADTLMKSAAYIYPQRNTVPHVIWVALMLRGYAVENLLKGLWAERDGISSEGRVRFPGVPDHDLVAFAWVAIGEQPHGELRALLSTLSKAVRFLGRYPVSLKARDFPVHTPDERDPEALWCESYETRFWIFVSETASRLSFLEKLPSTWMESVIDKTWRRPCSG